MRLIGICGLARSGKDTAAYYLSMEMGLYKYAFAEPLKHMLKSVFGDHFHDGDREAIEPVSGVSFRKLMQTLGTEWGRNQVNPQLWTNLVQEKWEWIKAGAPRDLPRGVCKDLPQADAATAPYSGLVISDVRFENEAQWIRDQGGLVLHIHRPGPRPVGVDKHASEAGVARREGDYAIYNGGSLDSFYKELSIFIRSGVLEQPVGA